MALLEIGQSVANTSQHVQGLAGPSMSHIRPGDRSFARQPIAPRSAGTAAACVLPLDPNGSPPVVGASVTCCSAPA
jgi:hypothetical protein